MTTQLYIWAKGDVLSVSTFNIVCAPLPSGNELLKAEASILSIWVTHRYNLQDTLAVIATVVQWH